MNEEKKMDYFRKYLEKSQPGSILSCYPFFEAFPVPSHIILFWCSLQRLKNCSTYSSLMTFAYISGSTMRSFLGPIRSSSSKQITRIIDIQQIVPICYCRLGSKHSLSREPCCPMTDFNLTPLFL